MTSKQKYTGVQTVTFIDKKTGAERKSEIDYDQIFIGEDGYVFNWNQYRLLSRHLAGFVDGKKPTQAQWGQARKLEGAMRNYYGTIVDPMTRGQFQEILDTKAKAPKALMDMLYSDTPKAKAKAKTKVVKPSVAAKKLSDDDIKELSNNPELLKALLKAQNLA
jgi:hypothetical protein